MTVHRDVKHRRLIGFEDRDARVHETVLPTLVHACALKTKSAPIRSGCGEMTRRLPPCSLAYCLCVYNVYTCMCVCVRVYVCVCI